MDGRISHLRCTKCLRSFQSLDAIVQCSGKCGSVFHVLCINLKDNESKALLECDRLFWLCDCCENVELKSVSLLLPKLIATIAELSSDIKELKAAGVVKRNAGSDCIVNSTTSPENSKTEPTTTKNRKSCPESEDNIDLCDSIQNRKSCPVSEDNIDLCNSIQNRKRSPESEDNIDLCDSIQNRKSCPESEDNIDLCDSIQNRKGCPDSEDNIDLCDSIQNRKSCPESEDNIDLCDSIKYGIKLSKNVDGIEMASPRFYRMALYSVLSPVEEQTSQITELKSKERNSKPTETSECNSSVRSIENDEVGDHIEDSLESFRKYGGIEVREPKNRSFSIAEKDPGNGNSMIFEMSTLPYPGSKEFPLQNSVIEMVEDTHIEPSVLASSILSPGPALAANFSKVFPRRRKQARHSPLDTNILGLESIIEFKNSNEEIDISQDVCDKENKCPTSCPLEESSLNESFPSTITLDDREPEDTPNPINTRTRVSSLAKRPSSPENNQCSFANELPTPQSSKPAPVKNKSTPAKGQPSSAKKRSSTLSPQPPTSRSVSKVKKKEVPVKPQPSSSSVDRLSVQSSKDNTDNSETCGRRTRNVVKCYKEMPLNKKMRR